MQIPAVTAGAWPFGQNESKLLKGRDSASCCSAAAAAAWQQLTTVE